jgi:beta-phosphoglucomutase-like phosphatase (HAD superfamily)
MVTTRRSVRAARRAWDRATRAQQARAPARLGVQPPRGAVVEDALGGVEAARAGDFGLVVEVDRVGHAGALRQHDVVVSNLAELLA